MTQHNDILDFKDHFSQVASSYGAYRPSYPPQLVEALIEWVPSTDRALDCSCGTGQLSTLLARYFTEVIATDASRTQIQQAQPMANIQYRVALAEKSGLPDNSVDLITVAQAAHWLDLSIFYQEVRRVAKPNAVIALITYGILQVEGAVNAKIQTFYHEVIADFWPPERQHVENGYEHLDFPFSQIPIKPLSMTVHWDLVALMGYLNTWSAVKEAKAALGYNPVDKLHETIRFDWGDTHKKRQITWALSVKVGKIKPSAV